MSDKPPGRCAELGKSALLDAAAPAAKAGALALRNTAVHKLRPWY